MSSTTENWRNFILKSEARHLLFARTETNYSSEKVDESEVDELAGKVDDLSLLVRIHYLLQPKLQHFVDEILPSLLRSISHAAASDEFVSRGGIKGKVRWPKTLTLRASGRGDSSTHVLIRPERSYDQPENQLLKSLLSWISSESRALESALGVDKQSHLVEKIRDGRLRVEEALAHPHLRAVRGSSNLTALMKQRARRHRNRGYGIALELAELYLDVTHYDEWERTLYLLSAGWLEPLSDERLFELYYLMLILEVVSNGLGFTEVVRYGIIAPKQSGEVATLETPGPWLKKRVRIYFDRAAQAVARNHHADYKAKYQRIVEKYYGITASARRPDLIVEVEHQQGSVRRVVLELKESASSSYINDGIYKSFGYLYDFKELWALNQGVRVILAIPGRVTPTPQLEEQEVRGIFSPLNIIAGDKARLTSLLRNGLSV